MTFGVSKFRGFLFVATMNMLIEFLMGLSDSVVAGNLLGENALAGVNLLQSPMNLISFFANMIGTGTAICFALETGRFNKNRARDMFSQGFWSAIALGGILLVAFLVGRAWFLGLFGVAPEVHAMASAYWKCFVPCAFLEPFVVLLVSACYADGDGRTCVVSYIVQLVGNVGLSILFVKLMGIGGCALGTGLGYLGALAVLATHFLRRTNTLRLVRHFSFRDLFSLMKSSFGDAATRLCWVVLFAVLNKLTVDCFGSEMLAVTGVVIALLGVSEAFNGVPNAAQPLVGVYVGERNYRGVRTVMRAAGVTAVLEGAALMTLLLCFPILAVRLVGIDDPALVAKACTAVRITAAGLVFWSVATLFNSYYLFIERVALSCFLTILANLAVPCVLLVPAAKWGASAMWWALTVTPLAAVLITAAYVVVRYGRAAFPLLLPRDRDAKMKVFNAWLEPAAICAVSRQVGAALAGAGVEKGIVARASLLVEEVFMAVRDRNGTRRVAGEVALDLNDGVSLVLRDDGEIFDITDADARIASLRTYLVASIMEQQANRCNLTTTGFNRNVFKFN